MSNIEMKKDLEIGIESLKVGEERIYRPRKK